MELLFQATCFPSPRLRQLVTAIQRDVVPTFGANDHRVNRDDQIVRQLVLHFIATTRILIIPSKVQESK